MKYDIKPVSVGRPKNVALSDVVRLRPIVLIELLNLCLAKGVEDPRSHTITVKKRIVVSESKMSEM